MNDDIEIIDAINAYNVEVDDQIVIDGDFLEVRSIEDVDIDVIAIKGYSYNTGDIETYNVDVYQYFDVWSV